MMTDETLTPQEPEDASLTPTPDEPTAMPEPVPTPEPAPEPAPEPTPEPTPEPAPVAEAPAVEAPAVPEPTPEPEPAPVPAPVPVAAAPVSQEDDMALFEAAMDALEAGEDMPEGGYKKLNRGDRVEATVIQVDRDKVFVDLGTKSEGELPVSELTDENIEHANELVKVGDKIQVVVIRPEGTGGNLVVSKKRADFEAAWDQIEETFQAGTMLTAQVVDRVKGGLVVDIGVRGFVPATHVGNGKLRNIEKYVGQPMSLKIIEIDRDRKKVVLSNRQADEERRANAREEIFVKVQPGEILEGSVRRLTDYGAFVDLGGVDGLLHISEMSWMRINHPKEMFKEGQKIKVMVLKLDPEAGKISLGHRQVLPDPWKLISEHYVLNQKLNCTISRIVAAGAFVKLPEGAEAFIPVSEMSGRRIRKPEEVIEENQEVEVQVIDLRPDQRRMVLSMRAISGGMDPVRSGMGGGGAPSSYEEDDRKRGLGGGAGSGPVKKKGAKGKGRGRDDEFDDYAPTRRGFATGGATIGERLGALRGILSRDLDDDDVDDETTDVIAEVDADVEPVEKTEEVAEAEAVEKTEEA